MSTQSVVLHDIQALSEDVPWPEIDVLGKRLAHADRVYAYAVGRCGLVLRMFVMRLMHLGFACHFVGEVTTPAIGRDDLLLVASGSGRTATVVTVVGQAHAAGAGVVLLSSDATTPLAARCDHVVRLPGISKLVLDGGKQPPGSTFEQVLFCFLEETVVVLMQRLGVAASEIMARHANVE